MLSEMLTKLVMNHFNIYFYHFHTTWENFNFRETFQIRNMQGLHDFCKIGEGDEERLRVAALLSI